MPSTDPGGSVSLTRADAIERLTEPLTDPPSLTVAHDRTGRMWVMRARRPGLAPANLSFRQILLQDLGYPRQKLSPSEAARHKVSAAGNFGRLRLELLGFRQPRQRTRSALAFEKHQGHAVEAVDHRYRGRDTRDRHRAMQVDHYSVHHLCKPARRASQVHHETRP